MKLVFNQFLAYSPIFKPVLFVIFGGILGGYIGASFFLLLTVMFTKNHILEILLVLLLFTFFLADSYNGFFAFAQNFRYVMLGVSLFFLARYKLIEKSDANFMLPFTITALIITVLFSPLGILAVLRAVAFWLVCLVIFKFIKILSQRNRKQITELLLLTITLYVFVNIFFLIFPVISVFQLGRFKGLAGNPNGLALLSIFLFALVEYISETNITVFKKQFFLFLKIILVVIVLLTGSRTSLFSLLIFIALINFYDKTLLLIIALTGILLSYLLVTVDNIQSFLNYFGLSDFLRVNSLSDASGRTDVWPVVWNEVKKNIWFGNGIMYDNFFLADYVKKYIGQVGAARQWGGVWSSYLSLLLNVGVIGFVMYLFFWIRIYFKSHHKKIALPFIVMCFLCGVTESWMAASMNPFTPVMFVFWAMQTQALKKE